MHVLMLTSTLPRFRGDLQANFVGEQAAAWLAARNHHNITILAPHDRMAKRQERTDRLETRRFRYFLPARAQALAYPAIMPNIRRNPLLVAQLPFFLSAQYQAAHRILKGTETRLIYAHWVMPQGLVAYWLKQRTGTPYILQNHSSDLAVFAKLGRAGRSLARNVLLGAEHFFCVNALQREAALEMVGPASRESFDAKCTVLPMGIAPPGEMDLENHRYDIGTIGRLSRKKGLDLLIGAAEQLAATGVRPRIGIAGDGEEGETLRALPAASDTHFVGFVSGPEKHEFMDVCGRFAFPACAAEGDVEGMPVALLEALATGRPVLASEDTNIRLLPEWDAISDHVEFIADPGDRAAMADAMVRLLARSATSNHELVTIIARYRWDRLIEEYLAPIEALASVKS